MDRRSAASFAVGLVVGAVAFSLLPAEEVPPPPLEPGAVPAGQLRASPAGGGSPARAGAVLHAPTAIPGAGFTGTPSSQSSSTGAAIAPLLAPPGGASPQLPGKPSGTGPSSSEGASSPTGPTPGLLQEHLSSAPSAWNELAASLEARAGGAGLAAQARELARSVPAATGELPPLQPLLRYLLREKALVDSIRSRGWDAGEPGRQLDALLSAAPSLPPR